MPKIEKDKVKYREKDFETAECQYCRYFLEEQKECKVVEGDIDPEFVSNAYQGAEGKYKKYTVSSPEALIKGMIKLQPYQHKVIDGFDTPEGWLVIIEDTMKPKPHIFSLDLKFHVEHTSREHHWTQEEVDRIEKQKQKLSEEEYSKLSEEEKDTYDEEDVKKGSEHEE